MWYIRGGVYNCKIAGQKLRVIMWTQTYAYDAKPFSNTTQ